MELQGVCKDFLNTSRVECIFSKYKTNYVFSNMNITNAVKRLCNFANILIIESINSMKKFNPDQCFCIIPYNNYYSDLIGLFYKKYFSQEFSKYKYGVFNNANVCCWCVLRNKYPMLSIPCVHTIGNMNDIIVENIPPRYIRSISAEKISELTHTHSVCSIL